MDDEADAVFAGLQNYMGITKPRTYLHPVPSISTQVHPPPPSSFQSPSSSIYLHPAHFSLHPALCNIFNFMKKMSHIIGQFPQI